LLYRFVQSVGLFVLIVPYNL